MKNILIPISKYLLLLIFTFLVFLKNSDTKVDCLSDNLFSSKQKKIPQVRCAGEKYAALRANHQQSIILSVQGAELEISAGSLSESKIVSLESIDCEHLPLLDDDLVNVTLGGGGFRCLPHGTIFEKSVALRMDYDTALIPSGYTKANIKTLYFDENARRWMQIPKDSLFACSNRIASKTTHFTDFINGIIKVADAPVTNLMVQNSIKDLKAADASAGIITIAPPKANNTGSAGLDYPLKFPPARQGMQPQVGIRYNSEGGNSWLGMGWDVDVPSIGIETRWGVPRFDANLESETYLLAGAQLSPVTHRASLLPRMSGEKQFFPRVEGGFQKITRHGDDPKTYFWVVTQKDGTQSTYGGNDNTVLKDNTGNIVQWMLRETRDLNDNFVRYEYETVQNLGLVNGTVMGREIYLQNIYYTGHGTEDGPFSIKFMRKSGREDVQITARLGFKQVIADRLSSIEIAYNNQPVRSYELEYKTGAFFKTLLASITEKDRNGEVFTRHDFDYFDEVRQNGQYKPFKSKKEWHVEGHDLKGGLITDLPGFRDKVSAISGAKTSSWGVNMSLTVGGLGAFWVKTNTVGGNFGLNRSSGEGILALVDINGDGLPDIVFRQDGKLKYCKNLHSQGDSTAFSSEARDITGVTKFSSFKTKGNSIGVEANISYFFVGHTWSKSKTVTETYFADFNGDRLIDIAHKGRVYFNHINADGDPVFTLDSDDTPNPVVTGEAIDSTLITTPPGELDTLINENPLHDVIRVWEAPFDGMVTVDAPVELIEDNSPMAQDYTQKDGVRVAIQFNNVEKWKNFIPASAAGMAFIPNIQPTFSVHKGDRLYFRVQSVFDGAYDKVHWNPKITYQNLPAAPLDANGKNPAIYRASEDFVLTAPQSIGLPFDGQIGVSGIFKKEKTSDDVRLEIVKRTATNSEIVLFSRNYTWQTAITDSIAASFPVDSSDEITCRLVTSTNLDWANDVSWKPKVFYTAFANGMATQDAMGNYILQFFPAVGYSMFNDVQSYSALWVASDTGIVKVSAFELPFFSQHPEVNGVVNLSAKGVKKLFGKTSFTIQNGHITSGSVTNFIANVLPGDSLFIEYHVQNDTLVDSLRTLMPVQPFYAVVSMNGNSQTVEAGVFTNPKMPWLGPLYRGWGFFAYNGNRDRADNVIKIASLDEPPASDPGTIPQQDSDIKPKYDPRNTKIVMLYPDVQFNGWRGFDDLTFIKADSISSSRLGEDDLRSDVNTSYGSGGSGLSAPKKVNKSKQKSWSVGASIIPFVSGSMSNSTGETEILYNAQDMNNDGYPDIISPEKIQYTNQLGGLEKDAIVHNFRNQDGKSESTGLSSGPSSVSQAKENSETPNFWGSTGTAAAKASNAGKKADATQKAASGSFSANISTSTGKENTLNSWIDINGDGLPDKLFEDGRVALNYGYTFGTPENWGFEGIQEGKNEDFGAGATLGFSYGLNSIMGGIGLNRTEGEVTLTLHDVNSDGLADFMFKHNQTGQILVKLNMGNGFAPEIEWDGVESLDVSKSVGLSANVAFTVCIPVLFFRICFNPGGNIGQGVSRQESQLVDIDGDGFADFLTSTNDGEMFVKSSSIGKTNILKSVKRPFGSDFSLDFEKTGNTYKMPSSKWVLKSVELRENIISNDGSDRIKSVFVYEDGHYNRREHEFYGFKTVKSTQLDTENGDVPYRTVVQTFANEHYYEKGLLLVETMTDAAGKKYTETQNTYEIRTLTGILHPNPSIDDATSAFPALISTKKLFYEGQSIAGLSTETTFDYDLWGNIKYYADQGDGTAMDFLSAAITYHDNDQKYIKSVPQSLEVFANQQLIRRRETDMDATGNVTQIRQYLENGTAATHDMAFDDFGNLIKMTNPVNKNGERLWFEYQYDNNLNTYVVETKDAYGYSSSNQYDPIFGQLLESIDLNGQKMTYKIDDLGRLTTITGPYELAAGKPYTIAFEYHPEAVVPYAKTRHYDPETGGDIETITFMDGLMRPVQVKKTGVIWNGTNDVVKMIVSGRTKFDALGRTIESYYPVEEDLGGNNVQFNTSFDGISPISNSFDVLDRPLTTTLPDASVTTTQYGISADNMGIVGFETKVIDALGSEKSGFSDVRGRNRASKFIGPEGEIWNNLRYNALSEVLEVADNDGNLTLSEYDQLGRRIAFTLPDAGRTEFGYDLAGNKITVLTAELKAKIGDTAFIHFTYDHQRLVQIDYPKNFQNKVELIYGKSGESFNRAGRVYLQKDASGGQEFFFGPLGETVKTIRTMLIASENQQTFVSESKFDTWGRIQEMSYPDGEIVSYQYNAAGKLKAMTGQKSNHNYQYVNQIGYDKFEQQSYFVHGNSTITTYNYEPERRRLSNMNVTLPGGKAIMDNQYAYDAMNNVLSVSNAMPSTQALKIGGPVTQNYKYDALYRLTEASGNWKGHNRTESYTLNMEYDNLHNVRQKTQQHFRNNTLVAEGTCNFEYKYDGNQAHAANKIGQRLYNYDANGNTTGWKSENHFSYRNILWDEENRISAISDNGLVSRYTYDAAGERAVKSTGGGQSLFVNGAPSGFVQHNDNYTAYVSPELVVREGTFTKHYFIEGQRITSKTGTGYFSNKYHFNQGLTAGGLNYTKRANLLQHAITGQYMALNVSPNAPTLQGLTNSPEITGIPVSISNIPDSVYSIVPPQWGLLPRRNGSVPSVPVYATQVPITNDSVRAGYGYAINTSYEQNQYFFHPDHLGSASYITDRKGELREHLEYMPFGETFVEEHTSIGGQDYRFTGKELDAETGLYYFGARYYDPITSVWQSVDPMAEKYAGWSPYNYVMLNPVKLVDPDGKESNNTPTAAPTNIIGTTHYYQWRQNDFKQRNPNLKAPEYYSKYGDKYIQIFSADTRPKLSEKGKAWLDKALINLQNHIEKQLSSNPNIELDNEKFNEVAFESHVPAYLEAGLLDLDLNDKIIIGLTPDLVDILQPKGLEQVISIGLSQIEKTVQHLLPENKPKPDFEGGGGGFSGGGGTSDW
jgi:RHS repeat-associated protein